MDKKVFVKYLDEIFKPLGFKKKGNKWRLEGDELIRLVILQKSKYCNSYYLNYGFILNNLNLQNLEMHIFNRLSSLNDYENRQIMNLLDFENNLSEDDRKQNLLPFIEKYILGELMFTRTENELLNNLKKRPHLNDVPIVVKRYFKIA